jgi:CheY-like chemotaxis protein
MINLNSYWATVDKHIKGRVVLVADSNPYLRSILRTILLQIGVKATREVGDGFEAIDAICAFDPLATILDWNIRGMDAREVVRVIRKSGIVPDPQMPIIGVTNPIQKMKVMEAKELGIDHLLLRPISPKLLQEHLFPSILKMVQSMSVLKSDGPDTDLGLLTPERVAEMLKVSPSWLGSLRKEGDGPPHLLVGRRVRYRKAALARWIEAREEKQSHKKQSPRRKAQPKTRNDLEASVSPNQ